MTANGSDIIRGWPKESREAAQLVLDKYGEPDEATDSQLIWRKCGEWKRIVASKAFLQHDFPAPTRTALKASSTIACRRTGSPISRRSTEA